MLLYLFVFLEFCFFLNIIPQRIGKTFYLHVRVQILKQIEVTQNYIEKLKQGVGLRYLSCRVVPLGKGLFVQLL